MQGKIKSLTKRQQYWFDKIEDWKSTGKTISDDSLNRGLLLNQIHLFDEAEFDALPDNEGVAVEEEIIVPSHTRRKSGRKKLPESLPRIKVVHALTEEERICPHDGQRLTEIGEVVSEQLDIAAAKIQVIQHIRKKGTAKLSTIKPDNPNEKVKNTLLWL